MRSEDRYWFSSLVKGLEGLNRCFFDEQAWTMLLVASVSCSVRCGLGKTEWEVEIAGQGVS